MFDTDPDLEIDDEELQISLTPGEDKDQLILVYKVTYAVPTQFRKYLQASAELDGTTFEEQMSKFYEDAAGEIDPDMATGHTSLFVGEVGKCYAASHLLESAFNKIGLFDFFDVVDTRADIERCLSKMRSFLNETEHAELDAAIEAALDLDGAAVFRHVVEGLKDVTARWPVEEE